MNEREWEILKLVLQFAIIPLIIAVFRIHSCFEKRLDQTERRIGGTDEDGSLSEQLAIMQASVELRHQENVRYQQQAQRDADRRFEEVKRRTEEVLQQTRELHDWWRSSMERRRRGDE